MVTPLEALFNILLSGFLIGVLVSAPMGPIGVLCIQRTLIKGRKTGFYTGVGAALSDMIYCLLTGFGLSFVTDFIQTNQAALQVFGSLVLVAYSVFLFQSNPARTIKPGAASDTSNYWRDFVTGFIFTFSNPLILFFIIGLFARFNFMDHNMMFYHYIAGYLAIAAGAIAWWTVITYTVNKVRSRFNLRSMRIVNRVIAVILCIMGLFGLVTGIYTLIA